MRNYIRHPTSIPIQVYSHGYDVERVSVQNLSAGGLSFVTEEAVKVGSMVDFLIPLVKPDYQGSGIIVWRKERPPNMFEVGVRFTSDDEFFRTRMVEQVCRIEDYRQQLVAKGRSLNSEEAALEWIAKHAANFDEDQ